MEVTGDFHRRNKLSTPENTSRRDVLLSALTRLLDELRTSKATNKNLENKIESLERKIDSLTEKVDTITTAITELSRPKQVQITSKPDCLPFETLNDVMAFDNVSEDVYDSVVDYFIYLGGMTPQQCASLYIKESFDEINHDFSRDYTWSGTRHQQALQTTRFAKACEAAMNSNQNFLPPTREEIKLAMTKELKNQAERSRKRSMNALAAGVKSELKCLPRHFSDSKKITKTYKRRRVDQTKHEAEDDDDDDDDDIFWNSLTVGEKSIGGGPSLFDDLES